MSCSARRCAAEGEGNDDMIKIFGVVARSKPPVGYIGFWINVYERKPYAKHQTSAFAGGSYKRRVDADRIAKPYRKDCVYVWCPND